MTDGKQEESRGTALGPQYNPQVYNFFKNVEQSSNSEIIPGYDKLESLNIFDEIY